MARRIRMKQHLAEAVQIALAVFVPLMLATLGCGRDAEAPTVDQSDQRGEEVRQREIRSETTEESPPAAEESADGDRATEPQTEGRTDEIIPATADRSGEEETASGNQKEEDRSPRRIAEREYVTIVVAGEFAPKELDQLLWNIARRTDEPHSAVAEMRSSSEGTAFRVRVGPVADVRAFAERLSGVTVEEIDEKQRTITVRRERDRSPRTGGDDA